MMNAVQLQASKSCLFPGQKLRRLTVTYSGDRVDRIRKTDLPNAPPAQAPPRPPPPPPPPEGEGSSMNQGVDRRTLIGAFFGATALRWAFIKYNVPVASSDTTRNVTVLKTQGGNLVAATADSSGRLFLFDRLGNIYYDTGDSRLGFFIVDTSGDMFNLFIDERGSPQRAAVGNLAELKAIKVSQIGGVPIKDLANSIKELKGGTLIGFPRIPTKNDANWQDYMPANAPIEYDKNGNFVRGPPILEEFDIKLEPRKQGMFSNFFSTRGKEDEKDFDPVVEFLQFKRDDLAPVKKPFENVGK